MPLLVTKRLILFFAHVPKTGGSSIKNYLTRRFGRMTLSGPDYALPGRRALFTSSEHFAVEDLGEFLPDELDYCFAVVRDPVARTLSQYRWQAGKSAASRLSFSTWLRIMVRAAQIDPRIYENHLRPQVDLVPDSAEVFRLEEGLERVIERLDTVAGETAPDIQMPRILDKSKGPQSAIAMTRQDVALMHDFYRADYERFGYPPPDTAGLAQDNLAGFRTFLGRLVAPLLVWKQRWSYVR